MALAMRNLLPGTVSVVSVYLICWIPLPQTYKQQPTGQCYPTNYQTYKCTTALRIFATGSFQRECGQLLMKLAPGQFKLH